MHAYEWRHNVRVVCPVKKSRHPDDRIGGSCCNWLQASASIAEPFKRESYMGDQIIEEKRRTGGTHASGWCGVVPSDTSSAHRAPICLHCLINMARECVAQKAKEKRSEEKRRENGAASSTRTIVRVLYVLHWFISFNWLWFGFVGPTISDFCLPGKQLDWSSSELLYFSVASTPYATTWQNKKSG